MSNNQKQSADTEAVRKAHWIWAVMAALLAVGLLAAWAFCHQPGAEPAAPGVPVETNQPEPSESGQAPVQPQEEARDTEPTAPTQESVQNPEPENTQTLPVLSEPEETEQPSDTSLGHDVALLEVGKYTGAFMEDGSDEFLTDVLMMKVVNNGEQAIQYAEITMDYGGETARFTLSTLLPGASMILLEQTRMAYSSDASWGEPEMANVAVFREPLSLCQDRLKLQILDGAINVTNISGQDIPGEVRIYYKNYTDNTYYGGITYVVRIRDGIPADEVRQIMASHFSEPGSVIMFVECE